MSRSKHAVELCALLVDETYGELSSRIFTVLLRRGRLPISLLVQHTHLTPRQLRHGLAVLVQQNLVYHHFDNDTGTTHYEANHEAAYGLVRSGKIMEIIESRYGVLARDVVQNLLLLGHTKVSDLAEAYESSQNHPVDGSGIVQFTANGSNGRAQTHIGSAGQLDSILYPLLQANLVEPVTENMFRSPTDTYNQVEKEILQLHFGGSTKGTKQKDELKGKVREKLQSIRSEGRSWKITGHKKAPYGDLVNGTNGTSKRRRLSGGAGANNDNNGYEDEGIRLERDLVIRVNYDKCTVALRNQRLVELARCRVGETTSEIYAELLRLVEEQIPRCRPDPTIDDVDDMTEGPSVTTMELAAAMSKSVNVALGIGKVTSDKIDTTILEKAHQAKKRKANEFEADVEGDASSDEDESDEEKTGGNISEADEDPDSDGEDRFADGPVLKAPAKRAKVTFQDKLPKSAPPEDRQNRLRQIKSHLMLLAGDEFHFLRRCGARGDGEWTVDFDRLVEHLQETELDSILFENFGKTGHRLVRIMRKLGKLDEKQLPNLALMKQKDVRTKLAEMQMAGMVDIQEVPRDNNRTSSRTIFLWYFDTHRVSSVVLDGIYKTMSRCLQRLEVEKRRADAIIQLSERSDVRDGNEEAYFTPLQLNGLREIRGKEETLLGEIDKLDELVAIFRDY